MLPARSRTWNDTVWHGVSFPQVPNTKDCVGLCSRHNQTQSLTLNSRRPVLEWRQHWCSRWGLTVERFEDTNMKDIVDTRAFGKL
jgi:hypothetical protein